MTDPCPPPAWPAQADAPHMNDNDNHGEQRLGRAPALVQELWLGALETLVNAFIDIDPETRAQVRARDGLIVRVKTSDPFLVFYMHFTPEGIEFSSRSPGAARVRLAGTLLTLAGALLGGHGLDTPGKVRLWGENDDVAWLMDLMRQFNLRTSAQRWLREHVHLDSLWQKISHHDPSWISDLMPMPGMMREALNEIRALRRQLEAQQEAWQAQQLALQQQRRWDIGMMVLVLATLLIALLPGTTLIERLHGLTTERLLWIALTLALIGTRFWRR